MNLHAMLAQRAADGRPLRAGEGGFTVYGKLMPAAASLAGDYLPLGLAHKVRLQRDIADGQPVGWNDVAFDAGSEAVQFRREMEAAFR